MKIYWQGRVSLIGTNLLNAGRLGGHITEDRFNTYRLHVDVNFH